MANSESQPSEPVKKRAFSACLVERIYMVAISVSQEVTETLSQPWAIKFFRRWPWKGTKILKITF